MLGNIKDNKAFKTLICGTIERAVCDYRSDKLFYASKNSDLGKTRLQLDAERWLRSQTCRWYCESIGLDYIGMIKELGIEGKIAI